MYFHQLHGLRYGKTGCVEELCFHSSKTVLLLDCAHFQETSFFWESTDIVHLLLSLRSPCPNMY